MKVIKKIFGVALLLALLWGGRYLWQALPIISGYGAKNMCSCVFVAGRSPESVLAQELAKSPLNLGKFTVSYADSSVTGTVAGIASKKAIFRKGLGCTLLSELSEEEVRQQAFRLAAKPRVNQDTLPWPMGNQLPDSLSVPFSLPALQAVVQTAFEESNPEAPQNTRAVVVLYDGQLVYEQYAQGFDVNTPQIGWSMTKSITSTLVGILQSQGRLEVKNLAPVAEWQADERKNITLDQLLRASSGLAWEENYGGPADATHMLFKSADMGAFAAKSPQGKAPDTEFYYSSGTTNIISRIVRQTLGEEVYHAFPYEQLFYKIGMHSAVMEPDASGTFVGSSYTFATPRDWARFGLLFYQKGQWQGEQIVPADWVSYSVTPTPPAPQGEYGAQWWLNAGAKDNPENRNMPDVPSDCFSANGFEGQRVMIIPSEKLVIVRLGLTQSGNFDFNQFTKKIIEAVHVPAQP
ncbi:serine hydrolase [Cytophagales bacterium LB-30]|uniref:Serine hydrolase n=1 Tax=Shiella aurantiaca TaxID=3058365 RepID=A0ABT8F190_9BACT|nr:serine hydrolase [Shiella aurantiaca]MDN4164192.1 serine hydrolase [Shiella aurantiaca]